MVTKRYFKPPERTSYFLFGPRGTGKSTLMAALYPDALLINLLLPDTRRPYLAKPDRLLDVVRAQPEGKTIVIDEVQKIPELLSLVHVLIEEKQQWQFVLTGSSARKLKREGVNLLGGRALDKHLHPFMASELGEGFDLQQALNSGLLPLAVASDTVQETLSAYVTLYLEEEVKAEGFIRDIEPFSHFLEVLSFSHGSLLNLSHVARECRLKRATVDNWLSIAEDLLIAFRLPVFSRRAKRILTTQLKFYYFDSGVYQILRPRSVIDSRSEVGGAALEGLVAQHLRAWIDYSHAKHKLYYWRTKSGVEVDFIVYGEKGLWAIEVKYSGYVDSKDLRGLKNFKEDYPESTPIMLYQGDERILRDGILCMPCDEFLKQLVPNQSLPV
ncbi:MAG: ATPase [marine bacterium B5-7]|nr:MAG: ATPase [marine bacterium B5-7]